jgi:hypothetical protein
MNGSSEWVISLSRLSLPAGSEAKRVSVSAASGAEEVFIQNVKTPKNNKINFYRESLFLSTQPLQLCFNLYQVSDAGHRILLKTLAVGPQHLPLQAHPQAHRLSEEGFQLDWESWLFREDSEELNEVTEREYSELEFPLFQEEQEEGDYGQDSFEGSNTSHSQQEGVAGNMKRRSNSTDESSSPDLK